jgi:nitrate/TMAO reductase-like tetraheme cytochrome c subunit
MSGSLWKIKKEFCKSIFSWRIGAVYVAVPLVFLLGLGGFSLSSKQRTCGFCHARHVRSLGLSVHNDTACTECHEKPTWLKPGNRASRCEGNGVVSNEDCKRCHSDLSDSVTYLGKQMPHSEHMGSGLSCLDCHSGVGHGKGIGLALDLTSNKCSSCHSSAKRVVLPTTAPAIDQKKPIKVHQVQLLKFAPSKQATCPVMHVSPTSNKPKAEPKPDPDEKLNRKPDKPADKPSKPDSHNLPDWLKTHGMVEDKSSCQTCHGKENTCATCHGGIEMPHPSGWMMNHKLGGASFDPKSSCFKCHEKKKHCGRCHKAQT